MVVFNPKRHLHRIGGSYVPGYFLRPANMPPDTMHTFSLTQDECEAMYEKS